MVKALLQNIAVVLLSLIVSLFLLAILEGIGSILHPFPADFAGTTEEIERQVASYPTWVLALLGSAGWGLTMVVATWIATRFNASRDTSTGYGIGIGVGIVLFAAAIFNMSMLPYPLWFWIVNQLVLPLGIFLGVRLGMKR